MSNEIEIITYRGREIKTYHDDNPIDDEPGNWYESGYLIYDHRDCQIAPRDKKPSFANVINQLWIESKDDTTEIDGESYFVFPVFAYIHGDVVLYLSEQKARRYEPTGFDISMKGFVVIKQCEEFHYKDVALEEAHRIVKSYNMMLAGEIYGYQSDFGSCLGYWGEDGYKQMIAEAKDEIDGELHYLMKKRFETLKRYIKNKVPIIYRKLPEVA